MLWHTECVMRMMFRSWSLAVQILVRENVDSTPTNTAHTAQHSNNHALGSRLTSPKRDLHCIFVPKNKCCHLVCHMSHPWLFSHAPFSMSTSSSSSTFPSAPQEHAVQSVYQEQLREHSVDEQRYPEPFCCENLQSGGNPRTTTPTGYEPKQLETNIIETEAYSGDPYQLYEIQE